MKKNNAGFVQIILVFVVLALVGGAYYFGKISNKSNVVVETPTEEPVATETQKPGTSTIKPTADPTANWKEYKLSELGLSLKLPPELSLLGTWKVENLPGDTGNNICFKLQPKSSFFVKTVLAGGVGICDGEFFRVNSNSVDYSAGRGGVFGDISGYRKLNGQYYAGVKAYANQPPISNELISEIVNKNGLKYLRIIGSDSTEGEYKGPVSGTPGQGSIGALILTNNPQYPGITVSMNLSNKMTPELFDQILSTFKFTK